MQKKKQSNNLSKKKKKSEGESSSAPAKNGFKCDWDSLKHWFLDEKRDLPWRNNPTPYQVWISEIMLQQTQVSVVIPYYERWMNRFPTVKSLAEASLDEVIKLWEGLGYYSRARNIHEAAKYLIEMHEGNLPQEKEALEKIKGIGPYTVGAIQSFAFKMKAAAVDGNVIRVLSRYFFIEEDISKPKTIQQMREFLESQLPDNEPWIISEALIELGATICQKKPRCEICPLNDSCKGLMQGKANALPVKSEKIKYEKLYRIVGVVEWNDHFLVQKGEKGKIMSDLYEFPYVEGNQDDFEKFFKSKFEINFVQEHTKVAQSFTRFRVELTPLQYIAKEKAAIDGYEWKSREEIQLLPFSSGHRKILREVLC